MTKKTLFSSGDGHTVLQSQNVPKRRPREGSHETVDRNDVAYRPGGGIQRSEYWSFNHPPAVGRYDDPEVVASPATETATSPSVGYLSYTEALSPASVYTPSNVHFVPDSSHQPTRKRARTMSNSDDTVKASEHGRRRNDLAGILNPAPIDEPQSHGQQMRISDLDNPDTTMTDNKVKPNAVIVPIPMSQRLATSRPFVEIQPRPAGQDVLMTDADKPAEGDDLKRKGRKGPLESDQRRAEVLEVREIGACLRCHVMRIRCTANKDEACSNCKATLPKSRKWEIPCSREWLRTRWECLMPDMLRRRHDPEMSIPTIPTIYLGQTFKLPLTHSSDFKFEIDARIVRVSPDQRVHFENFTYDQQGEGPTAKMLLEAAQGWPLVPTMRPGQMSYDHTVRMLEHHLETQIEHSSKRWVANFLPAKRGQRWAREIFQLVVYYQNEVSHSQVLRKGFDILFIRYLQNHPFFIPLDRLAEVNKELPEEDQRSWSELKDIQVKHEECCPKYVNRWLKSALLKIYEKRLPNFFQELEALFKLTETTGDQTVKMSSLDRDETFAALILALILVATAQVKLLQAGTAWDEELPLKTERYLKRSAREAIFEMETRLVDHCLQLYKYRFYKESMKGKVPADKQETAEKAARFNIIGEFDRLRLRHEDSVADLSTTLDPSEAGEDLFMSHNHTRLLKRLSELIWRPKSQRRQT